MAVSAFIEYLRLERKFSVHTQSAYRRDLDQFSDFCTSEFGETRIEEVSYPMIRSWIVHLVDQGIGNRSINRKIASLKAYFKFMLRTGSVEINPLATHKSLKTAKKIELPFSESEMERVFREITFEEGMEGMRDKLIIDLLYTTGIRRAELINLRLQDIDIGAEVIKVTGKRNKQRIIPLTTGTLELLQQYLEARNRLGIGEGVEAVFLTKSGDKIYETLVYRIINGYFSKVSSKLKKSPHILRHTFATHLLNKGADLNSVKELLGHSSLASTQVYTHNSIAELKKIHSASHPRGK